jgi:hypothetical protein
MRELRVLTENDRLHIVVDGYTKEDQARLLELLADFSRGVSDPAPERIEDFEPVATVDADISAAEEVKVIDKAPVHTQDILKMAYTNFLKALNQGNEMYVHHMFCGIKGQIPALQTLSEDEKKAFGQAFREWFSERYKEDPFATDKKAASKKRAFFGLYDRYLKAEIQSLEQQYGLEMGSFQKNASNEQIEEAYELCRRDMLKRCLETKTH